jgi:hypothetical protein
MKSTPATKRDTIEIGFRTLILKIYFATDTCETKN